MEQIMKFITENKESIELAIAILGIISTWVSTLFSSARGAIALVNEIFLAGVNMSNEEALQKASDKMGTVTPYIPEFVRKWLIQIAFDNMKKALNKEVKPV